MKTSTLVLAAMAVLAPAPAHAYVDPGTGAMLLQLLLGGVAGAAVVAKLYWARLREFFRKPKTAKSETRPLDRRG